MTKFLGEVEEEVQLWEQLVDTIHNRQAVNGNRSYIGQLFDRCFVQVDGKKNKFVLPSRTLPWGLIF